MKHYPSLLCFLFCITLNFHGTTQPRLITQFDKTRCSAFTHMYEVDQLPDAFKFPISFNGNMELHKWVLWMVKGKSFQVLDQGIARSFVYVELPTIGQYVIVIDERVNPLLIEIKVKETMLSVSTYSHCATH